MSNRESDPVEATSIEAAKEPTAPPALPLTSSAVGMAEPTMPETSWHGWVSASPASRRRWRPARGGQRCGRTPTAAAMEGPV